MDYLVLGDTREELFSFIHRQTQTPNTNSDQRDSQQIPSGRQR
jgi:hypothetical protein